MSDLIYRMRNDELSHAYKSKYISVGSYTNYNPVSRHERYEKTKEIVGRKARTKNPYGNYASPYYDPVKRKQYYEEHKDHKTRPYGVGTSKSGGSGRKGGSGKGSKGGSGGRKGSKGSKGSRSDLAKIIKALREESAESTQAQRERAQAEIERIRRELSENIEKLKIDNYYNIHDSKNLTEIRGFTQGLQSQIENLQGKSDKEVARVSKRLRSWIKNEKQSLARRIEAVQKQHGKK